MAQAAWRQALNAPFLPDMKAYTADAWNHQFAWSEESFGHSSLYWATDRADDTRADTLADGTVGAPILDSMELLQNFYNRTRRIPTAREFMGEIYRSQSHQRHIISENFLLSADDMFRQQYSAIANPEQINFSHMSYALYQAGAKGISNFGSMSMAVNLTSVGYPAKIIRAPKNAFIRVAVGMDYDPKTGEELRYYMGGNAPYSSSLRDFSCLIDESILPEKKFLELFEPIAQRERIALCDR